MFKKVGGIVVLWLLALPTMADTVAYLAFTESYWQVWLMSGDGSHQRQLTKTPYDKNSVTWYPDGKKLLVNGTQGDLVVVDIKTGNEKPLDFLIKGFADAVLSYDGKYIAFSLNAADGSDDNNIWIIDSDGKNAKKITDMAWLQHEPRWGRDSGILYFLSGHGQQVHDIWKIDILKGDKEQLTAGALYNFDVHATPKGELYFSSNRGGNYDIWKRDIDGKEQQITSDPAFEASPALSPDALTLLFESSHAGRTNLWARDMKLQAEKQLTHHKLGARKPVYFYGEKK